MREDAGLVGRTILGNYVVERLIGRGAMGAIYQARHKVLGRRVAVKVLRHNLKDKPEERERFQAEAETIARLSHPNVVTILDFGTLPDGSPCIVTEFVDGETITDILEAEGPIEPWRATRIVQQVLSALIEAHSMGIVHRDIKCDNIMVQRLRDGREQAKLVDFGISLMEGRRNLDANYIFGTPLYMCPEQCRGELPDGRGDLYSLGVVFFEMLTGEPLFYFENPYDYLNAHINLPPPRPSEVADQPIPEAIEAVIMKLLEKDPKDRFQSAQEVKQALNQWEASRKSTDTGIVPSTFRASAEPKRYHPVSSERVAARARMSEETTVGILVADRELLEALAATVRKFGYVPARYVSAADALRDLRSGRSQDVYLVGLGGDARQISYLVSELLVADPLAEVVFVSERLTNGALPEEVQWAASDLVVKPFADLKAFAGRLQAAVKRREATIVQSRLLRKAMDALKDARDAGSVLAGDLQQMLERTVSEPPRVVALVSEPARKALERRGHTVYEATSLDTLGRQLARRSLDAVVVETGILEDLGAPELASFVLARRPDLELVLVGFQHELPELLEGVQLGATDFVLKPIEDLEIFSRKVEIAVGRRRRRLRIRRLLRVVEAHEDEDAPLAERFRHMREALRETIVIEAETLGAPSPLEHLERSPTALVAVPDRIVASVLQRGLETLGWQVVAVTLPEMAVDAAMQDEFDLALVWAPDSGWPGEQALEVLGERQPQTPVALVGQEVPRPPQIGQNQWLGVVPLPISGLEALRRIVRRAVRLRRRLLSFEVGPESATEKMAVLLVEPDASVAKEIETLLVDRGWSVLVSDGLEDASAKLERYDVDVVALNQDLLLGADEGTLELLETLQTAAPTCSYGRPAGKTAVLSLLAAGAERVLPWPLDLPQSFLDGLKQARTAT